ncbi:hypothetical protein [Clostridium pasteurianum]|nr:hypothetical protein [Clostridium pasteurianum]
MIESTIIFIVGMPTAILSVNLENIPTRDGNKDNNPPAMRE